MLAPRLPSGGHGPGINGERGAGRLHQLLCACCREDAEPLVEVLEPLAGSRCVSIASAGDHALSLVAREAEEVQAVDTSLAQLALVELKMTAFRHLEHPELLEFLGVRPCRDRAAVYASLRRELGREARAFWDARESLVDEGVIHAGRLERCFRIFRRWVLPLVHSGRTVAALLNARGFEEQERFYEVAWDTWRWRLLSRLFFSRAVMGRLCRDVAFLSRARRTVTAPLLERTCWGFTARPSDDHPYLHYALTGRFGPRVPDFLHPEHHEPIRRGLDRIRLVHAPVEEVLQRVPRHSIGVFDLSDLVACMNPDAFHRLLEGVHRAAAPGARVAYRKPLPHQDRPDRMQGRPADRDWPASSLHARILGPFCGALVLEVVR